MVRDIMLGSPVLDGPDVQLAVSMVNGEVRADAYVYTLNEEDKTRDPFMELTTHVTTWRPVDGDEKNVRDVVMWVYDNAVTAARDNMSSYTPTPTHVKAVEVTVREFEVVVITQKREL